MAKSSTLLNAIKAEASQEYQDRIPTATQDNLAEVGSAIIDYEPTRNEFVNAIFNKIAKTYIEMMEFENPLAELKRGKIEFGQDIEELFVDLIMSEAFDPLKAETTLFKRELPKILATYHRLNRQEVYPNTVEDVQLSLAFQSETGFEQLISAIISRPETSNQYDEFLLMKNLIAVAGTEGKLGLVSVQPVIDEATAKQALVEIKKVTNGLLFPSRAYNFANVVTTTPKKDQIILVHKDFDALLSVEVLAYAFNMSKVQFEQQSIIVDDFGGLDALCMVMDRRWFMVEDKENRSTSQYNPKGLYTNYFKHVWQMLSSSPFNNAVLFVTGTPTLTSIDVKRFDSRTDYTPKEIFQLYVEATGSTDPYPPSKVTYSHNGLSEKTYIATNGLVSIGDDETQDPLVITAKSTFDEAITDTLSLTKV